MRLWAHLRVAYLLQSSLLGLHVVERLLHLVKFHAQIRDGSVLCVWTLVVCSGESERGEQRERGREREIRSSVSVPQEFETSFMKEIQTLRSKCSDSYLRLLSPEESRASPEPDR